MKRQVEPQAFEDGIVYIRITLEHQQQNRRPKHGNEYLSSFDPNDPSQVTMYNSYIASLASYYAALQQQQQQQYSQHIYNPSLSYASSPMYPIAPSSSSSFFYQQQFQQASGNTTTSSSPLPPSRTIYLGNITDSTKHSEIFDLVKLGPVVEVKLLPDKKCAFIEFLDLPISLSFFNFYSKSPPIIPSSQIPLKVAFAKSSTPVPLNIQAAMNAIPPATRVAYVGGLDENQLNEAYLLEKFSPYGTIESIRMLKDKKTAFVHFVSVSSAIKLVSLFSSSSTTPMTLGLPGSKICYGKDRFPTTSRPSISEQKPGYPGLNRSPKMMPPSIPMSQFSTFCMQNSHLFKIPGVPSPFTQNHRTIFLGSVPEETTLSDLANVIRGGQLFNLKIVPEKNCAFVTFVRASDALLFFTNVAGTKPVISHLELAMPDGDAESKQTDDCKTNISSDVPGIYVLGRKIFKIGFGKPIEFTNEMMDAVEKGGATRNLYIGIPTGSPQELPDEATIIQEFLQFGTIESVVRVPEKKVAFVNFANLVSALRALVDTRTNSIFENCKIIYGKDRCAAPLPSPEPASNHVGLAIPPPPPVPSIQNFPFPPHSFPHFVVPPTYQTTATMHHSAQHPTNSDK